MKNSFDGRLIGFLSSLVSTWENTAAASATPARTVHLKRDAIIRLEKSSGVKSVEVKSGSLWLTSTPASGDMLLERGDRFETGEHWPYVIQALEPVELVFSARPA